jgi:hypothetical protein
VITINVEEADDGKRDAARVSLRDPTATLLGHFRHEVGHYYWDRLIAGHSWIEPYRELFGDERADYCTALRPITKMAARPAGAMHTSPAMPPATRGKTGPRAGRTTCTVLDSLETALGFGLSATRSRYRTRRRFPGAPTLWAPARIRAAGRGPVFRTTAWSELTDGSERAFAAAWDSRTSIRS